MRRSSASPRLPGEFQLPPSLRSSTPLGRVPRAANDNVPRHVPFVRTRWFAALMGGTIVALALGGLMLTGT